MDKLLQWIYPNTQTMDLGMLKRAVKTFVIKSQGEPDKLGALGERNTTPGTDSGPDRAWGLTLARLAFLVLWIPGLQLEAS